MSMVTSFLNRNVDRPVAWRFLVEMGGVTVGEFTECSGIGASRHVQRISEGGSLIEHVLPGGITESDITLKRGIVDLALVEWLNNTETGHLPDLRNLSIVLADTAGEEVRRWALEGVYPSSWSGPELKADSAELALETLVLARGGNTESGNGGGDGSDSSDEGLDVDQLSRSDLEMILDSLIDLVKTDLRYETERLGRDRFW